MPRKTVRFQNKQGDWKSTNKQYGNLPKSVRRSMRTRQKIMKQTRPITISKEQKVITTKDSNITLVSSAVIRKEFPNKDQHTREDNTVYANPTTGIISVTQSEEASRYTPKKTVTTAEVADDESIIISKIGGRDPRVVSETQVRVIPPPERFVKTLELEAQFKKWNQLPPGKEKSNSVLRLSNQELRQVREGYEDIPTGGIHNKSTVIEKNLREKIVKQEMPKERKINEPNHPPFREKFTASVVHKTEEEKTYFQRLRTSDISDEKKKMIIESAKKADVENRRGGMVPLKDIRPELKKKGLTRFEQDVGLIQLNKERKIDLQSPSEANLINTKDPIIPDNERNPLYYLVLRR